MPGVPQGPPGTLQPRGCPAADSSAHPSCVANQTQAGTMYGRFLAALRARPELVGYAHCQYINRAVQLPSKLKQGLLNFDGTPHHEFVDAITRANRLLLREGG